MSTTALSAQFKTLYSREPEHIFFCPGRVNLIGEHIDYNGGQVLPAAISMGTYLAVSRNTEQRFRFQAIDFPETADMPLQSSYRKTGSQWFHYPLGVLDRLLQEGHALPGLDLLFYGNLPVGAGLSSSASIEVLMGYALNQLGGLKKTNLELALLAKETENNFIGVNCGIMDQFAVAMGKKDQAMLLNCDTLDYAYIPFRTAPYALYIINTNKQRSLAESKYNERFAECRAALNNLNQEMNLVHLCEAGPADFERHQHLLTDPVLQKRARHVITENQRVKDAVIALQTGDMEIFGKLLFASHASLRDDYEVSGIELDTIVEFCRSYSACLGARMTGAGFGGCAIALLPASDEQVFTEQLMAYYTERIGYPPSIFRATAGEGVREIKD